MDLTIAKTQSNGDIEMAPFEFYESIARSPILAACPHSGRFYPQELFDQSDLSIESLRESEDAFTDMLCREFPSKGAHLICANYGRSYIDLNRNPDVLDDKIIEGVAKNSCQMTNSGFGVVPRLVGMGKEIYREKISLESALQRIKNIHQPYHNKISEIMQNLQKDFDKVYFLDIHSMPSAGLGAFKSDIVLGDRFGTSCSKSLILFIESYFKDIGLKVRLNHPFAGGYSTIKYGAPNQNQEALQIEINRALYMDESSLMPNTGFENMKQTLNTLMDKFREYLGQN